MSDPNRRILRWAALAVIAGVLVIGSAVFFTIGNWLVVADPLTRADAIVVLSGHLPDRALEAARIYQGGYAPQVWISPPLSPEEELKAMNIAFLGEDFYNEKVLLAQGVPADAIRVLDHPSANTQEEVREIKDTLQRNDFHNVIIVTSKPHTRRVRTIWKKLAGPDFHAIVRYGNDDPYDGAHWWRHTHDALDVMRETLGLLNAWAGFPLRPSAY